MTRPASSVVSYPSSTQSGVRLFLPVVGRPDEGIRAAIVPEGLILDLCLSSSPAHGIGSDPTLPQMSMPRARRHNESRPPSIDLIPQPDFALGSRLLPGPHMIRVAGREIAKI